MNGNATSSKVQSNASVARRNQAVQILEQLQYSMQEPGKPSKGRGVQTVVRRNQASGSAAIIPPCMGPTSPNAGKMQEVE